MVETLQVTMVTDVKTGKPRGYAFIEYEREKDMHGTNSTNNSLTTHSPSPHLLFPPQSQSHRAGAPDPVPDRRHRRLSEPEPSFSLPFHIPFPA